MYWYVALIDIEVLSFRVLGRGICEMRDDWPSLVETYARTCSLFKPKAVVGTMFSFPEFGKICHLLMHHLDL